MSLRSKLAAAALLIATACGDAAVVPKTQATPQRPRTHDVATLDETFVDRSRGTDPVLGRKGDELDHRQIATKIWYPESNKAAIPEAFPIVLFSHGLGSVPDGYAALVEPWVEDGFVVVAPTYPLTNGGVRTIPRDLINQPADASFVLDEVIELNDKAGHALNGLLDTDRIAAAGHSLGGMTTVGMLKGRNFDERLDAAVVMAGSNYGFAALHVKEAAPPVFFVHGDDDRVVPLHGGREVFDDVRGPRAFLTLKGGDHVRPFHDASDPHLADNSRATLLFLRWTLKDDDAALAELKRDFKDALQEELD